jgi:hypothetical protein
LNNVSIKEVYASLHKISEAVTAALKLNLGEIGVNLLMSRVIRIEPEDETLRRVIQLNGLGLDINTAVRARLSELMALRSDPAATNMLLGVPYYPMNIIMGGGGLAQMLPQTQLIPTSAPQAQQAQSKQQQPQQ